jgi:hypothetical protein
MNGARSSAFRFELWAWSGQERRKAAPSHLGVQLRSGRLFILSRKRRKDTMGASRKSAGKRARCINGPLLVGNTLVLHAPSIFYRRTCRLLCPREIVGMPLGCARRFNGPSALCALLLFIVVGRETQVRAEKMREKGGRTTSITTPFRAERASHIIHRRAENAHIRCTTKVEGEWKFLAFVPGWYLIGNFQII